MKPTKETDDLCARISSEEPPAALDMVASHARQLEARLAEAEEKLSCGGPLNVERWTLSEFLKEMERVKSIASDRTCVSFECFCWGASSLWHQTHRDAFRQVDRKPEELSRFVGEEMGGVNTADFPKQVLSLLESMKSERDELRAKMKSTSVT